MNLFAVTFLTQLDDVDEEKRFLFRFDAVGYGQAYTPMAPLVARPGMAPEEQRTTSADVALPVHAPEEHRHARLEARPDA
eukprot:UN3727